MSRNNSSNLIGAIAWMTVAIFLFSLVAIGGREASRGVPTSQILFWRAAIGVAALSLIIVATGQSWRGVKCHQPKLQFARSILHLGAQYSWLVALTLIPLAQVFALEFTAPLWVAILAPFLLRERLTIYRIVAAIIGFGGALVVVWPWGTGAAFSLSLGSMFALASGLGFALNLMATKQLTKTDTSLAILFWMSLIQTIVGLVFMIDGFITLSPITFFWLLMIGLGSLTAHYAVTRAFRLADAIFVAPLDFLRVPLIAAVGAAFYSEALAPAVAVGALCILVGNGVNLFGERRGRR